MFDPLAWGLGFVLTRLSDRLLKACSSDPLRSRLCGEAREWASELPGDLPKTYEYIFGEAEIDITPESCPARFRLQFALKDGATVPSQDEWLEAFCEHWERRRSMLGNQGNAFFQLDAKVARSHLSGLAKRMHRCCQQDTSLALPSLGKQLEELVSAKRLEVATRNRLELVPSFARNLSVPAQALILDKPDGWECRLFSETLVHELARHSLLQRDYENGLFIGERIPLDKVNNFISWLRAHITEASHFGKNISVLLNEQLQQAFGPHGEPGDPESIVYVAIRLSDIYRRAIEWSISINRVAADEEFSEILRLCSRLVSDIIKQIREFSRDLSMEFSALDKQVDTSPEPRVVRLTLTLTVPEGITAAIELEIDRLIKHFEKHPYSYRH